MVDQGTRILFMHGPAVQIFTEVVLLSICSLFSLVRSLLPRIIPSRWLLDTTYCGFRLLSAHHSDN